jgi:di/tricarboxylate transporter
MDSGQLIVFSVLAAALVLFVWNRWRYDVVALLALLVVALTGLVPPEEVFAGFGHPAVVTVAAVLVLSRGLINAGAVGMLARQLNRVGNRLTVQVATLTGIVAISSGIMNNVGALALLMPVAIWMSRQSGRSPSLLLMPLAFGSLLGGTLTLIGTPPNIIIAAYREQTGAPPFGMFDFLPTGAAITLTGLVFITLIGWRLIPQRKNTESAEELFEIIGYLTEVHIPVGCRYNDRTLHDLLAAVKNDAEVLVTGLVRDGVREELPSTYKILRERDILQVEADSDSLKTLLDVTGLELAVNAGKDRKTTEEQGDLHLAEVIVIHGSSLIGRTASGFDLRERHGVNVLAVARQGHRLRERLSHIHFVAGDILLVQSDKDSLQSALAEIGCLPLASRGLRIGKPQNILLVTGIFAGALALIVFGLVPAATALVGGAVAMVLARLISPVEIYKSIDMPVIVLLAAMLPVGKALETTGGSRLIAEGLLEIAQSAPPAVMLALLMGATMILTNLVNNAAAAVLVAPVALDLARAMESSADPLLMTVAIGASCAFLTPIGHQSNTIVMEPGGYRFSDYWQMGLPLSVLVVATSVPVILWIWPL